MKNLQDIKIGFLGGGQLGRMLIQAAADINVEIHVLDPDLDAPCSSLTRHFKQGSITDFDTVYNFGKDLDLISIEIENVNTAALKKLENQGKKVFPQPHIIELIQDKGLQKQFYREHDIPTADFFLVENKTDVKSYTDRFPFYQKLRKGGYDGKGVCRLDSEKSLARAFDAPSVLEKVIDHVKELSVIVARNESGESKCFPAVECVFSPDAHLVEYLFSPADISPAAEKEVAGIATSIAAKLGIVGLLAVELFMTADGKILVNEIAPRPHNSGHHTIEANITSQFAQHLRAIMGLPLGDTSAIGSGAMVNLLGEPGYNGPAKYQGLEDVLKLSGVYVHIYGKKNTKPNRKMGHVTIVGKGIAEIKKNAVVVKETLKVLS